MRKIYTFFLLFTVLLGTLEAKDIYATFTVEAEKRADLAFVMTGIVAQVNADIGSAVKEGEVLATLQNDDLKASLEMTRTTLKFAKRDYERRRKIKSIIDQAEYDRYLSKYALAKAKLKYQQTILDKTVLKAPFDGVIYGKSIEKGDAVSGAMLRTVFKIQSRYERKLIVEFDQKYWADVKVGDGFTYKVDGSDATYSGKIVKIYPAIDTQKRKVKAEVYAKDIMVGLFGDGTIHTAAKE